MNEYELDLIKRLEKPKYSFKECEDFIKKVKYFLDIGSKSANDFYFGELK
jgi:hypothetical protein